MSVVDIIVIVDVEIVTGLPNLMHFKEKTRKIMRIRYLRGFNSNTMAAITPERRAKRMAAQSSIQIRKNQLFLN